MTTPMSTIRRRGISPVTLVVVILFAIIAVGIAFMMFTEQVKAKKDLDEVRAMNAAVEAATREVSNEKIDLEKYVDNSKEAPEGPHGELPNLQQYLMKLSTPGITADPKDFSIIVPKYEHRLDLVKRLAHSVDLRIAEAGKAADVDKAAHQVTVQKYRERVAEKNAEYDALVNKIDAMEKRKAAELAAIEKHTRELEQQYDDAMTRWEEEKDVLLKETEKTTRRNAVVQREIEKLRPEPTLPMPAGKVVRVDWRTRKAVINLGEGQVFPGFIFEVYYYDKQGRQVIKGKLEVFKVVGPASVVNIVRSDPTDPIVAGDIIQTPFWTLDRGKKRFVVAGFIPPDAIYDEDQMKALIKLNHGVVQESVDLTTDVLILGRTSLSGVGEMDKKVIPVLQDRTRTGRVEAEKAREISVEIMDWQEFQASIRR